MRLLASCQPLARRTSLALAGVLALSLAAAGPSAAAPTSDPLPQGSDWSVTRVPGGFEITKQLGEPLPVVSDIPVLEVDGVPVGAAIESLDGTSVSVVTTADLTDVSSVELGWGSGGEKAVPADAPVTSALDPVVAQSKARLRTLSAAADDGSAPGTFSYVEDDYHFGHTAVPLAAIGGVRGEMTGRVYLPTTGGERPTVVLLHGRHTSCAVPAGQPSVSNPGRWPCVGAQVPIPSYKGYESLAQTLATHGYAVLSISANSVNANDNQLALDYGAQARGQLVLDTLEMLRKANAGEPVSFDDAATGTTVDLATALSVDTEAYDHGTAPTSGTNPGEALTPADLVGRFDLSNVGLMGHSRGGEGVVSSVNLNQALAEPFGITSVLPLAPVDFTRPSVADTDMLVLLPYCDGDVSNQQGQHFSDDSRYAFPDDSLRSTLWVMGTNHNFFNTVWTPGLYPLAVSDDWRAADSVCGPTAETTLRLSPEDQYQLGVATMSAWFRFTMGGEDAFGSMFDGSADPVLSSVPSAWLWSTATAPASARKDIETFTEPSSRVRPYGSVTLSTCASAGGRTVAQTLPACATASSIRSTSAMPHWTPASFAPNAPASPMLRMTWTSTTGSSAASARITVPAGSRDASSFDVLTFKTAPDESVLQGTDLAVTVLDGSGATWSAPVSAINPRAIERLPASGSTTLDKIVLQQVSIPVGRLAGTIDVTDVREIRIAGAVGLDAAQTGGVYLSDLALQSTSTGTQTGLAATPTINVAPTVIEEGDAPGEARVAVYLDRPATRQTTAWFTLIGSTTASGKAGLAAAKVTFAPGESCQAVTVPTYGDRSADATASVAYKMGVSVPSGVIVGAKQFGNLTIREDDHAADSAVALRAVGAQGDPCRELAELGTVGTVGVSPAQPAPGTTTTITAPGYRAGEHVVISDGDTTIGETLAGPDGVAALTWQVPAAAPLGTHTLSATGGTGRTSRGSAAVLTPTTSTLTMNPVVPAIGRATTLTVDVTGRPTGAVVTFRDGSTTLGTAPVVGGRATLELPRGLAAGRHDLTATTPATSTSTASSTSVIGFELVKGETTIVVITSATTVRYGTAVSGALAVGGAKGGTVTLKVGSATQAVRLDARGAGSFRLPATLAPGKHPVTLTHAATATTGASSARTTVTVVKARPTVKVKASKLRTGKKATVTVTVPGVSGAARPTGKVVVTLAGKKVATAKVNASGKTTVRVPVRKAGKQKIKVTYQGDTRYQGVTKTITARAR